MRQFFNSGPYKVINNHLVSYPTPLNLSYAYNFGSLAGVVLGSQIITGILLAMHYVGHVDLAFNSVVHLMNDVPSGMILRYAHANGASLFFIVVYIHILRGIYYSSGNQPREMTWVTGVLILLVMVITAFIGYVHSRKWLFNDAFILFNYLCEHHVALGIEYEDLPPWGPRFAGGAPRVRVSAGPLGHPWGPTGVINNPAQDTCMGLAELLTLNTKGHVKIKITPVKSYYNLHLIETQLKIQKDNRQKAGIFIVVNNVNGNFYVGSAITNRINTRFRNHCIHLRGSNRPLLRAINRYGIQNFSFHILEYFKGIVHKEDLNLNHLKLLERETFFINSLKPIYNILIIAGSSLGFKHTEQTRNKMKAIYSQERKDAVRNLNKGKPLAVETKAIPHLINRAPLLQQRALERYSDKDFNEQFLSDKDFKEQFLLRNKNHLFSGKSIILSNIAGEILSEYTSILQVSKVFSCDRKTVRKYLQTGKLFKNLGYLRYKIPPKP
jgi:group I intron endonuclease